jgi:hypothetical protein
MTVEGKIDLPEISKYSARALITVVLRVATSCLHHGNVPGLPRTAGLGLKIAMVRAKLYRMFLSVVDMIGQRQKVHSPCGFFHASVQLPY